MNSWWSNLQVTQIIPFAGNGKYIGISNLFILQSLSVNIMKYYRLSTDRGSI